MVAPREGVLQTTGNGKTDKNGKMAARRRGGRIVFCRGNYPAAATTFVST